MKISVIITTYNNPDFLRLVLHGYHMQTDRDFEIVVADDGSGEPTAEVIEAFSKASDIAIRRIWHEDKGFRKTTILNKAIKAARGEYLIFTDGDCVPRDDLVAAHRAFARSGHYVAGAYNRLPARTTRAVTVSALTSQKPFKIFWLLANGYVPARGVLRIILPRSLGPMLDKRGKVGKGRFPGGHSACFRADALAIGGFDERMTYGCEDREFGTRLCNSGVWPIRMKNSSYVVHLDHGRPYHDDAELEKNRIILRATEQRGRILAGHLE